MEKRYVLRAILFYLVPVSCGIVFTLLAELLIGYMTNAFANASLPMSPALVAICGVAGIVLLCALVLFVCSMYVIVLKGALMELRARRRLHTIALAHRKIELEKHRRELQRGGRRITIALNPDAVSRHHVRHHGSEF